MDQRPDLEGISAHLDSGAWDEDDLREYLREVLTYAQAIERQVRPQPAGGDDEG